MQHLRTAELHTIETRIAEAAARAEILDAFALMVLLRGYRARGGDERSDLLGAALSRALATYQHDASVDARAAWLTLFAEAIPLSDDERLRDAARDLVERLQSTWSGATRVTEVATSIDACLRASTVPEARAVAADAVDALERMVGHAYAPGQGMARALDGHPRVQGAAGEQVRSASALLTAYTVSGRLPYAMLAEELMQLAARRRLDGDLVSSCEAARVLTRLANLHDDPEYRAAAVIAPGADYRRDARRILADESARALAAGTDGAIYALALAELEFQDKYVD